MSELLQRITINPKQCGGRPCLRGMRIRVSDVLDLFAAGISTQEILEDFPDLEADDLKPPYYTHHVNSIIRYWSNDNILRLANAIERAKIKKQRQQQHL